MNAILICPDPRAPVALLAEAWPLAVAPLLGKPLVEYWIEHLAMLGAREIRLLVSDRPLDIADVVEDGARWGVAVTVTLEAGELSPEQAGEKYRAAPDTPPATVVLMDHLPGQPRFPLFDHYAGWVAALQNWMPRAQQIERIGQCEVSPGIWVGRRARIAASARLLAPCWLGDGVSVEAQAIVGPGVILEDGVVIAAGAQVARSVVGPATYVGARTRVENSIARGSTLLDWTTGSRLRVSDAFWLSSLRESPTDRRQPARPKTFPMKIEILDQRMCVTGPDELGAVNAARFAAEVRAALSFKLTDIEIDLSPTRHVDSCGLACLHALYRTIRPLGINLRLLRPGPEVLQLCDLTRMRHLFDPDPTVATTSSRPETAPADYPLVPNLVRSG